MSETTALERWADDVATFVKETEDLGRKLHELAMVPRAGSPEDRLQAFIRLWEALQIPNGESNPLNARTAAFVNRVAVGHAAETYFRSLLSGLESGILDGLKAGAQVPVLIAV
jgi:hypothetical protein